MVAFLLRSDELVHVGVGDPGREDRGARRCRYADPVRFPQRAHAQCGPDLLLAQPPAKQLCGLRRQVSALYELEVRDRRLGTRTAAARPTRSVCSVTTGP